MKNKLINVFALIAFIITLIIVFINPYTKKEYKIITEKDSYASKYAKNKNIDLEYIADTEYEYYQEINESFAYNNYQDGIEITEYQGKSKELLIPSMIDGKKVLSIKKGALKNVQKLVLAPTLQNIEEDLKNIKISCFNTDLCNDLKNDEDLDVTVLNDSDKFRVYYPNLDYEYNINDSIEITKYTGTSKELIIPEKINGLEVTKISLKINDIESIYIPSTVKNIDLIDIDSPYDFIFYFIIVMDIITLVLFILINYLNNKKSSLFNKAPLMLVSTVYLLFNYGFSIMTSINQYSDKMVIMMLIITSLVYVLLSFLLMASKEKIEEYDKKIDKIGSYVKDNLQILEDIDTSNYDQETLKKFNEVKELLEYSDPVSNDKTLDIEKNIQSLIKNNEGNKTYWEKIEKLMKKRNEICKNNKK